MVRQYGLLERLSSVEAIDLSVLDAERDKQKTIKRLSAAALNAKEKGAEVVIMGCAGMTGIRQDVELAAGLPVLDPVQVGYAQLELLVNLGLSTSKAGLYSFPYKKESLFL